MPFLPKVLFKADTMSSVATTVKDCLRQARLALLKKISHSYSGKSDIVSLDRNPIIINFSRANLDAVKFGLGRTLAFAHSETPPISARDSNSRSETKCGHIVNYHFDNCIVLPHKNDTPSRRNRIKYRMVRISLIGEIDDESKSGKGKRNRNEYYEGSDD